MTEALLKLASWLSPAYPVGGYTYSHGLEQAIETAAVNNAQTLRDWIADCLNHGAGRTDAILLAHAYRNPDDDSIAELAEALAPSTERRLEATAQGAAFAAVTSAAWGPDQPPAPYAIAIGHAASAHALPLEDAAALYLHAFAANLVSAGVRLIPLGQTDGQRVLAELSPLCRQTAIEALSSDLDDIGGCAMSADIASMRHETQTVRLFRS
ncbi:MAG: urease accessory protein UreF [Rhodobacteraceae bacterium]|nr:urease accessory protein UreF [Paracoccaceae bacterium]